MPYGSTTPLPLPLVCLAHQQCSARIIPGSTWVPLHGVSRTVVLIVPHWSGMGQGFPFAISAPNPPSEPRERQVPGPPKCRSTSQTGKIRNKSALVDSLLDTGHILLLRSRGGGGGCFRLALSFCVLYETWTIPVCVALNHALRLISLCPRQSADSGGMSRVGNQDCWPTRRVPFLAPQRHRRLQPLIYRIRRMPTLRSVSPPAKSRLIRSGACIFLTLRIPGITLRP